MSARERLDAIKGAVAAVDHRLADCIQPDLRAVLFICTETPDLVAALEAVLAAHRWTVLYEELCTHYGECECFETIDGNEWVNPNGAWHSVCSACRDADGELVDWPCETVSAIEAALGGEQS